MKKNLLLLLLSMLLLAGYAQTLSSDFKTIQINKKIKEFPDSFDLSSPLKALITFSYVNFNGKDRLLREVSTLRYRSEFPDSSAPDSQVSELRKSRILETIIKEIIYYKDSVACAISEVRDSLYSIRTFNLENSLWVQCGEDERKSIYESRKQFEKYAEENLQLLRRTIAFEKVPTDTTAFIRYLKTNSMNPKEFMLSKLNKYKLVMYGEIHRRKASWDFLQEIVKDKRFVKSTGVIFMEMESNKQHEIDRFLSNDYIDKELLLNIFRDYIVEGWNDKGKFDFLISVWSLNRSLPNYKKVKILFVDTPRLFTLEGLKNDTIDRDQFMAREILNYLVSKVDKRNALFIVGSKHVCKTLESAGSILTKHLTNKSYTLFTHCPRVDNFRIIHERIRHGIFDFAFYKNNDQPVAFELMNSPFGKEPFDGLYFDGTGTYQDNFDGYVFLGSLDTEPNDELLLEMYDDKFIDEIDKRYKLIGSSLSKEWGLKELTRNAIIDIILSEHTKTRWANYVKPLIDGKTIN
jgi:hypothetical protein